VYESNTSYVNVPVGTGAAFVGPTHPVSITVFPFHITTNLSGMYPPMFQSIP